MSEGTSQRAAESADADDLVSGAAAASAPEPADTPAQAKARRRHLYEVDILRILTFVCVISVHVVSHADSASDLGQNGFLILVHFTREVFFALTAFVLVLSFLAKPRPLREFWPKRFLLVALPYVTWSAVYDFASWVHSPSGTLGDWLANFWHDLYTGNAWYHLYFLLVTMQVYLLMPVIVWLVKKTRGHHGLVIGLSFAVEMFFTVCYQYYPSVIPHAISQYSRIEFWSYEFMIVLGAVAADHVDPLMAWVRRSRLTILGLVVAGALLSIAVYAINLGLGQSPVKASTALQPVVLVWSVPVILGFLALGTKWADQRVAGSRFARLVDTASDRSFGIFLAHPFFIWLLLLAGGGWITHTIPDGPRAVVLYVLVVLCTVAFIEILRRTPLSLPLTGRPFRSGRKKA
ncbi:acyltransferase [Frondihabitans australicus]|uniref:Peptidoglycan/LPS O-acetylase OafA/YrhL n=1 Tax=Frondihabitans australicus TaxID=386892 RepID=A0A495IGH5_9MICO|nr:acyltransferase [Frondihabitans australicus]RKR74508.1 peptidoglycan/LPS O-acetylase OafA/YrhL [Frondihabitans australicus]